MRSSARRKWQAVVCAAAVAVPLAGCGILPEPPPPGVTTEEVTEGLHAIAEESGSDGVLSLDLENFTGPEMTVAMAGDSHVTTWVWTPEDGVESVTDESLVNNLKFQIDALTVDRAAAELEALPACDKRWSVNLTPIGTEHAMALAMCADSAEEAAGNTAGHDVYFDGELFERGSVDLNDPANLAEQVAFGRELVGGGDLDLIVFQTRADGTGGLSVIAAEDGVDWEGEKCERTYNFASGADKPFQLWCSGVGFGESLLPNEAAEASIPADTEYNAEVAVQLAHEAGYENTEVYMRTMVMNFGGGADGANPLYEVGEGGSMEADYYTLEGEFVAHLNADGEFVRP